MAWRVQCVGPGSCIIVLIKLHPGPYGGITSVYSPIKSVNSNSSIPGVVLRCTPRALLQIADQQSSGRKTWKYSRYSLRFAYMDAGKEREQEWKLYASAIVPDIALPPPSLESSYLIVSGTCLLNQDLVRGSLVIKNFSKNIKTSINK